MKKNSTRVHFLGASRTVTGSKYLVEYKDLKLLVDCGLFQGKKELRDRNWSYLPTRIKDIDAVVLTHAHLDHTGYLPKLFEQGFRGPIYCTAPTKELTKYILLDSAHLQEEEAKHANKHKTSKHNPAKPLYTIEDAEGALELLRNIPRDKHTELLPGIKVLPKVAGHILGACSLTIQVGDKVINFSGDIGRYDAPLLPDPAPIEFGDMLLCESTYGDRTHSETSIENDLAKVIQTTSKKNAPLLIPSFAIGRTQTLLHIIRSLEDKGEIPKLPVYIDSPMAINATEVYETYGYDFGEEDSNKNTKKSLITANTYFTKTVDESKKLNFNKSPCIIIAGSGMATGGRILHHLKHWLPNPDTTVLFVGYQAEETRGARLLAGEPYLKMFGQNIPVKANIISISSLSAHADQKELTTWLKSSSGKPGKVKIVHGESKTTEVFSEYLKKEFSWEASPAEHSEIVEL